MEEQPRLEPIKNGWAALGKGWAVHGQTRDEALERFALAEQKHKEIDERAEALERFALAEQKHKEIDERMPQGSAYNP